MQEYSRVLKLQRALPPPQPSHGRCETRRGHVQRTPRPPVRSAQAGIPIPYSHTFTNHHGGWFSTHGDKSWQGRVRCMPSSKQRGWPLPLKRTLTKKAPCNQVIAGISPHVWPTGDSVHRARHLNPHSITPGTEGRTERQSSVVGHQRPDEQKGESHSLLNVSSRR
jgi:hypothetical protein